jgi:chaperonin GroES
MNETTGKITPVQVKAGDLVLLAQWGGSQVKVNDKEMLIIREEEILGLVETSDK